LGITRKRRENLHHFRGKLEYQACDQTICYWPTSVPLGWQIQVFPLDRTRAPVENSP